MANKSELPKGFQYTGRWEVYYDGNYRRVFDSEAEARTFAAARPEAGGARVAKEMRRTAAPKGPRLLGQIIHDAGSDRGDTVQGP